jgi:hypothetical protein
MPIPRIGDIAWSLAGRLGLRVPRYRLHDHTRDDLGSIQHAAGNLEPGVVVYVPDGRKALFTARVEAARSIA